MAEGVVSRPAEHWTAVPVVVLIAHESIGVLEFGPSPGVQVLGPFLSHSQMPLGGHGADNPVWVLWNVHVEVQDEEEKVCKCENNNNTEMGDLVPTRGEVVFGIGV